MSQSYFLALTSDFNRSKALFSKTVAEPLDVTARWHSTYQRDGAAKKQAVRELTSTLKKSLESMTNP